jgi:4-diphosphocytidyl-2-C-methyl-D-erythritol kinase
VGRVRPDGLHPLQSVVMFAGVGDWVEAASADVLEMRAATGPFGGHVAAEQNLVLHAARALASAGAVRAGAHLSLEKNLPVASGMGGGSADAAAALRALNELWALGASEAELMRIGRDLGADVPVCVPARTAWMTGVGAEISPMEAPPLDAVLVNPLKPLPTADVFRAFDSRGLGRALGETAPPVWRSLAEAVAGAAALGNDLAGPALALAPEIGEIERSLQADARVMYAALSGSGATCFAIVADAAAASSLAVHLSSRRPDWWVRATTLGAA